MFNRSCSPRALLLLGLLAAGCTTSGKASAVAESSTQTAQQGVQEAQGAAAMKQRFPALETRPSGLEVVARLEQTPGNLAITPEGRRVLQGHPSLNAENVSMVVEGRALTVSDKKVEPRLGLNPIALDPKGEWLYFGSMNGQTVWRVKMKDVTDPKLSAEELGGKVERYGTKAVSDGMSIDAAGNLYITDLGAGAIGVTKPDGSYGTHVKDELLRWPDGLSYGPDGYFYVTVNQLHRHAMFNQGKSDIQPPFLVVRFKPLAPSAVGR